MNSLDFTKLQIKVFFNIFLEKIGITKERINRFIEKDYLPYVKDHLFSKLRVFFDNEKNNGHSFSIENNILSVNTKRLYLHGFNFLEIVNGEYNNIKDNLRLCRVRHSFMKRVFTFIEEELSKQKNVDFDIDDSFILNYGNKTIYIDFKNHVMNADFDGEKEDINIHGLIIRISDSDNERRNLLIDMGYVSNNDFEIIGDTNTTISYYTTNDDKNDFFDFSRSF